VFHLVGCHCSITASGGVGLASSLNLDSRLGAVRPTPFANTAAQCRPKQNARSRMHAQKILFWKNSASFQIVFWKSDLELRFSFRKSSVEKSPTGKILQKIPGRKIPEFDRSAAKLRADRLEISSTRSFGAR
jgi:hypothetical protein